MAHQKKPINTEKQTALVYKEGAMSEIIGCVASEIDVSDSTEQLALTLIVKQIFNNDIIDMDFTKILQDAVIKILTSFVTHHLTLLIISLWHSPIITMQNTYQQINNFIS